jgi:hypothetical protein
LNRAAFRLSDRRRPYDVLTTFCSTARVVAVPALASSGAIVKENAPVIVVPEIVVPHPEMDKVFV